MVESSVASIVQIDGAMLEGGGQLFRMSMALAYLLKKPVNIKNIRAKRGNKAGGLGHQHLTGVSHFVNHHILVEIT